MKEKQPPDQERDANEKIDHIGFKRPSCDDFEARVISAPNDIPNQRETCRFQSDGCLKDAQIKQR